MAPAPQFLALLTVVPAVSDAFGPVPDRFMVCGNYCGPGWCNGGWIDESDCSESVAPQTFLGQVSCADKCCQAHDRCCGSSNREPCNRRIIDCLNNCIGLGYGCTKYGVPVTPQKIMTAMSLVASRCCGSPCAEAIALGTELHKMLQNKDIKIRDLTFEQLEQLAAFHSDTWYFPEDAVGLKAKLHSLIEKFPGHYEELWQDEHGEAEVHVA